MPTIIQKNVKCVSNLHCREFGNVFINRTYHIVSWRFKVLWGEIGCQHVKAPLAAASHPLNLRMNVKEDEIRDRDRPPHRGLF